MRFKCTQLGCASYETCRLRAKKRYVFYNYVLDMLPDLAHITHPELRHVLCA